HIHWSSSHFAAHQVVHSQLLKSISVSDGTRKNKPFNRNYALNDRSSQEDERRLPRGSSSGKWSSQKRLLTLFKQIETSIAQEKARSTNEREFTNSSKDYHVSFDTVLEALEEPSRTRKAPTLNKGSDSISHKKRATKTENEPNLPDPQPSALKAMRPPSSFMKKSPISSLSTEGIKSIELTAVELSEGGVEEEPLQLGKMKLTELKEVAKARGIKGYSKLKKSELVDLLSTKS
ncbi:hypothetical protein V2J09_006536, partial [Rumex salicifolius]